MSSDDRLTTDEIQRLLDEKLGKQAKPTKPAAPEIPKADIATEAASAPAKPAPSKAAQSSQMVQDDIERLINSAESGLKQASASKPAEPVNAQPFELNNLQPPANGGGQVISPSPLNLLSDVELDLRIELGHTNMRLEEVLQLRSGAVVALDKLAGDPVDVYVNNRMVARGEILVMNENFCVRVTELLSG
jgi:flagellar motor switch protein FliN/FliY